MYPLIDKQELIKRHNKAAELMKTQNVDCMLISGLTHLFYFTGTIQNGLLFIDASGNHVYFVRKSYERALNECPLDRIVPLKSLRIIQEQLSETLGYTPESMGFEGDILPWALYERYRKALPACNFKDISMGLRLNRAVKSSFEIDCIHQAGKQVGALFRHMKDFIKPGMTELNLAAESEKFVRNQGHQGSIRMRAFNAELFYSVISSGENANLPTNFDGPSGSKGLYPSAVHPAGHDLLKEGKPLLFDFMGAYLGYLCDNTRIYFPGTPSETVLMAHRQCVDLQNFIQERLKPGNIPSEIYEQGKAYAEKNGFYENLMGFKNNQVKFFGHGVGLEVDEFPVLAPGFDTPLEEGMAVAVEPKKYLEGIGATGVENTFIVRKDGGEKMVDFPDDIVILEW